MAFAAQGCQPAAQLVVKNTFLHTAEVPLKTHFALLRRAKTEPFSAPAAAEQEAEQELQGYTPGAYADAATSLTLEELLRTRRSNRKETSSSDLLSAGSTCSGGSTASSRSSSPDRASSASVTHELAHTPLPAGLVQRPCSPPAQAPQEETRTTVLLRNLPNNYTRAMLLTMLDREGFAGLYDFVYMPKDFRRHAGLGYAFVNLVDASLVPRFWRVFDGFRRWVIPTAKVCAVGWSSPFQGLEVHVERYRNSPVMHPNVPDEFRPVLFAKGQRIAFPPPTKELKAPMRKSS